MGEPLDLDRFAFELPVERIAQQPLPERDHARLMVMDRARGEVVGDGQVRDLPKLLRAGDLLVVNATRVLAARLRGRKASGGRAEALLLAPEGAAEDRRYRALIQSRGRLRVGARFVFAAAGDVPPLAAEVTALHDAGEASLVFDAGASPYALGEAPLPPYIRRPLPTGGASDEAQRRSDQERYQTVFARVPGAVAAPTAGLHLTRELLEQLEAAGVRRTEVVLHVGPGTFRPLRDADLARGRLHAEAYSLPQSAVDAVEETRARGGRVIAVGTTSTRVLESCVGASGRLEAGQGETELFIRPGEPFRVVDGLLTNFHLPRSSLLLLVAAFVGAQPILAAYRQAVNEGYRFYSYGDAMLIV
jgi:S-adenosylmethionine:tRNA ribosyltransferase-isomerase